MSDFKSSPNGISFSLSSLVESGCAGLPESGGTHTGEPDSTETPAYGDEEQK